MRSGDLSGLVPRLLSLCFISSLKLLSSFFHPEKVPALAGFFFFLVFFPPSATSVLRQSAANNQHILNGIIALCALLPASRWKPILEWIRQIHTCFLSPHPHPATQVQFGLLWGTIASLSAFFFFCFFLLLIFFHFSAQNGGSGSQVRFWPKQTEKKDTNPSFTSAEKWRNRIRDFTSSDRRNWTRDPNTVAAGPKGMERNGQRATRY